MSAAPSITTGGLTGQGKKIYKAFPYTSKSDPSKPAYQCVVYEDRTMSCNCPGWTRRVNNGVRECKHTQLTEQALKLLENADPSTTVFLKGNNKGIKDPTANTGRKFNFA